MDERKEISFSNKGERVEYEFGSATTDQVYKFESLTSVREEQTPASVSTVSVAFAFTIMLGAVIVLYVLKRRML